MKKNLLCKLCKGVAGTLFAVGIMIQLGIPSAAALAETSDVSEQMVQDGSMRMELMRNGNPVTEYVNDEDHKLKTIIWAQGITPPTMGGPNSQFKKQYTYDADGKVAYIDYIAPYLPGNGWYDVNKSENFAQNDLNLCFAAAASNSLHWWMDRNAEYIERFLATNPDDAQVQKLNELRNSFVNQQQSGVYTVFLKQFAGKKDGYWPDLLQDQFINGYYLKGNGGTNDSPADRDKLLNNGPDKNGGFFYKVFQTERLSERRYYDNGFEAISRELKQLFLNGDSVLMNYHVGVNNHVVTLWGVEYDQNGTISAVYYSDSDDASNQGMMRYRVINVNGKAVVTTHVEGKTRSVVECLQILSQGTKHWDAYFKEPGKTLNLIWDQTQLVYNGQVQAPTVKADNIQPGDQVVLSVKGGQVHAGTYVATAVLSGPDADRYELPAEHTKVFEIQKAPAPEIAAPKAGALVYGQKLADSKLVGDGEKFGCYTWSDPAYVPEVNNSGYRVQFEAFESVMQDYETPHFDAVVPVLVEKAIPAIELNAQVKQTEENQTLELSVQMQPSGEGELPAGIVTFEITDEAGKSIFEKVDLKNGSAEFIWNTADLQVYDVVVHYAGNENYSGVTSEKVTVDASKLTQDALSMQRIEDKTYGDAEFSLYTIGGSGNGEVTYQSSNPDVLQIQGNTAKVVKAGNAVITAIKAADDRYNAISCAMPVTVHQKQLTVTAEDKVIVQGQSMPEFTYQVEGIVNGDQFLEPVFIAEVKDTTVPGEYRITIQGGSLTNRESYELRYRSGTLLIREKEEQIFPEETPQSPVGNQPEKNPPMQPQEVTPNAAEPQRVIEMAPSVQQDVWVELEEAMELQPSEQTESSSSVAFTEHDSEEDTSEMQTEEAAAEVHDQGKPVLFSAGIAVLVLILILIAAFAVWSKRKNSN